MANDPAGTLTFLFTDIEGSTRRWQDDQVAMREALGRHDAILADLIEGAGGRIFKHTGDGVGAVFGSAQAAVGAAVDIQRRVGAEDWGPVGPLRIRVGVHTGEASQRDGDYFGPTLNRVARLMAAGHGGQVLVSSAAAALLESRPDQAFALLDLGQHVLRDIAQPERVYQVTAVGLDDRFPALRTGSVPTHNLPAQRTSFVGREADIVEIAELLAAAPVVTLVGIGGTGKTRLAIEVGRRVGDRFGAEYFVDLAPLAEGSQIQAAVAAACGLTSGAPAAGPLRDAIVAAIRRRPTLLILDNCEHLIDDCAEIVDDLLESCPELTVLATSREALSIDGERPWTVRSLPADESRQLFADRAAAADPNFRLGPEDEGAVVEICRRLDGIPLAIELAAARVGPLSPAELASRLDDRFRLLTGGRRRRTQRQHTLRAAIDWSYELLTPDEARLFRRLSVFVGGFTIDAIEAVCADGPDERAAVLDGLASLVGKSLVTVERSRSGTRYGMLETIRMYAADRLDDEGDVDRLRAAHRDHWLAFAARIPLGERLRDFWGNLNLGVELDNVRAAMDWSESEGRADLALELGLGYAPVWLAVEHQEEAAQRLETLAAHPDIDDAARARALALLSFVHMTRGAFRDMARSGRRSLALDPDSEWSPLAYSYCALYLVYAPDRYAEAHDLLERARTVAQAHGMPEALSLASGIESHFFLLEGRFDEIVAHVRDASSDSIDLNTLLAATVAHLVLGEIPEALETARRLLLDGGEEWGGPLHALVLAESGRAEEARTELAHLVDIYLDRPFPLLIGDFLIALARAEVESDAVYAAELLESVTAERGMESYRSPAMFMLWSRVRDEVRSRIDEAAYEAARSRCLGTTAADAVRKAAARLKRTPASA